MDIHTEVFRRVGCITLVKVAKCHCFNLNELWKLDSRVSVAPINGPTLSIVDCFVDEVVGLVDGEDAVVWRTGLGKDHCTAIVISSVVDQVFARCQCGLEYYDFVVTHTALRAYLDVSVKPNECGHAESDQDEDEGHHEKA